MIRNVAITALAIILTIASGASEARYVQSDPIGQKAGPSTYAYVESNPMIYFDPFGLEKNRACVAAYTTGGAICLGAAGYYGGGALGATGGAAAGGLVCSPSGPGALVCAGAAGTGGAVAGSQAGGAAGAFIGGILGNVIGEAVCPEDEPDCEKADNECFLECQHLLGQGGRTNQGFPYRNCWVSCMKKKGCYSGNSPVE
jgi:hypothetical protein